MTWLGLSSFALHREVFWLIGCDAEAAAHRSDVDAGMSRTSGERMAVNRRDAIVVLGWSVRLLSLTALAKCSATRGRRGIGTTTGTRLRMRGIRITAATPRNHRFNGVGAFLIAGRGGECPAGGGQGRHGEAIGRGAAGRRGHEVAVGRATAPRSHPH